MTGLLELLVGGVWVLVEWLRVVVMAPLAVMVFVIAYYVTRT